MAPKHQTHNARDDTPNLRSQGIQRTILTGVAGQKPPGLPTGGALPHSGQGHKGTGLKSSAALPPSRETGLGDAQEHKAKTLGNFSISKYLQVPPPG